MCWQPRSDFDHLDPPAVSQICAIPQKVVGGCNLHVWFWRLPAISLPRGGPLHWHEVINGTWHMAEFKLEYMDLVEVVNINMKFDLSQLSKHFKCKRDILSQDHVKSRSCNIRVQTRWIFSFSESNAIRWLVIHQTSYAKTFCYLFY